MNKLEQSLGEVLKEKVLGGKNKQQRRKNSGECILQSERVLEGLKKKMKVSIRKENMRCQTSEKEKILNPLKRTFCKR